MSISARCASAALLALPAVALACSAPQRPGGGEPDAPEPIQITLVGINDLHGALLDRPVATALDTPRAGGAAMLSAYIGAMRAENPGGVLVVDAGDMLQGPLLCNHFEGAPVADVYNHIGVAAVALGNHEFDYGPVGEESATGPDDTPFGALNAFSDRLDSPVLSANVSAAEWAIPAGVLPHHLVQVRGVGVGLIGLTTPTTPTQTLSDNVAGVRFGPVGPAVEQAVTELRAAGAEVIVVLGHLDGGCTVDRKWPPPEFCEPDGELVDVLAGAGGEVDAVFLGHRHAWLANVVGDVAVVEGGSRGRALSRVDLFVDPGTRRADRTRTVVSPPVPACEAVPATGDSCLSPGAAGPWTPATYAERDVKPDRGVDAILEPYVEQVEEVCRRRVATAAVPIGGGGDESPAGNLVADAMRAWRLGSHAAIINSGALRGFLPAGEVSYCDVFAMFPFDNRFVELELSGVELEQVLEIATSGAHSMPQISGLRITIEDGTGVPRDLDGDGEQERWERDRLLGVVDDAGRPLEPEATYRLVLSDYVYKRPGDAQYVLGRIPEDRVTLLPDRIRDAVMELLISRDEPLGEDGGWPLPQADRPRVRFESL